jgi:NodT family efflux transporter outer membrane factor (OMF) lipoprotein
MALIWYKHVPLAPIQLLLLFLVLFATGCSLSPKYRPAAVPIAPAYKEAITTDYWKLAEPRDNAIRGKWWEMYGDSQLNELENQIDAGNQSIVAAAANYAAARALVRQTRAQYFPSATTSPSITNARLAALPYAQAASGTTYTEYDFPISTSWEPDLWGRIRNTVRANVYAAQTSAADLDNVRLLEHANLAADYFQLRGVEQQKRILDATVGAWEKYLDLTRAPCKGGLAEDEALAAAEAELKTTQAQGTNLDIARAQYEHAIADLLGKSPSLFTISSSTQRATLPEIPTGVPAELLERRPDIAAAERTVAQMNVQIGIAKAAFFPNVLLSGTAGIESLNVSDWFTWPSRFWSAGPSAIETVFDAGGRRAAVQQSQALHDAAVANYRQTVLNAFQQVEDNLAALRILTENLKQQEAAVRSATRFLNQATARNTAGLDPFLNVLTARVSLLAYQQTYVTFQTQQMIASVQLIEALGGGWNKSQMPSSKEVRAANISKNSH